jgi:hypothetical protein
MRTGRERLPATATAPLVVLRYRTSTHRPGGPDLPLKAFPFWFLKITCDRCGKDRMLNEVHA